MDRRQRRLLYLEAMDIPVWVPRCRSPRSGEDDPAATGVTEMPGRLPDERRSPPELAANAGAQTAAPTAPPRPAAAAYPVAAMDWEELEACVRQCTACPLHRNRTQTVFGVGNRSASWLVIGEAPGEQEDLKGEPFVGRAGQLLNEMLRAVGLTRESVYIANVLKCRPPQNRDPEADEAAACEAFLKRQVALIRPKIILAVGRIAAQNLLKTGVSIGKLRGAVHRYADIPLVVTYHPAYLLRSPLEKRKAWDDLQLAMRTFRESQA